jgi:hypothetical protein
MEHLSHDNIEMENEHFAEVIAASLIRSGIVPDRELCERWLAEVYVNEEELELILETYEEIMEI